MELKRLLEDVDGVKLNNILYDYDVQGITTNSKKVKKGDIFICLQGDKFDGNLFIGEALSNGAVAIVTDKNINLPVSIKVKDARQAYSIMSRNFYNRACDKLKIVAVTGTNGKTTTVNIISDILKMAGHKVATVGSIGINYNGKTFETGLTTPDPDVLHKSFNDMLKDEIEYVVMETSAHAIALKKLAGIKFDLGILTNITQDHLDYFGDMESYARTKLDFFKLANMHLALVCSDDYRARRLINNPKLTTLSYGLDNPSDVFAVNIEENFSNTKFVCNALDEIIPIKTNLVGRYNVQNSLAAIGACRMLGVPSSVISNAMRYVSPVEGRFNVIKHPKCNVVIDFAHTPDALKNVLSTARELTSGKLYALFGCGGNRDTTKRPLMGRIASQYADEVILTSDNPREENPLKIIHDIEEGIESPYEVCENREDAIALALEKCIKGDTLVIAGKGSEKYQEVNGQKYPYNDFDAVYKYFRNHITTIKYEGENDEQS